MRLIAMCIFAAMLVSKHASAQAVAMTAQWTPFCGNLRPICISFPPGRDDVFFNASRTGRVFSTDLANLSCGDANGLTLPNVTTSTEQGLLGMAIHPDFDQNGFIYFYYTSILPELTGSTASSIAIARYTCPPPLRLIPDPATRTIIFVEPNSGISHIGGWIDFGPDALLYAGIGDGGSAARAQDLSTVRGKIIRIDVNQDDYPNDPLRNYAIPPQNPLATTGGHPEIFLWGVRNPFRCGFDTERRLLYIADVGLSTREEMSVVPIDAPGRNLGWPCFEGTFAANPAGCGPIESLVFPFIEYRPRDLPPLYRSGSSIMTGGAYTGCAMPALRHHVLFADYLWLNEIYSVEHVNGTYASVARHALTGIGNHITQFARDGKGEMYIISSGEIHKLIPATPQSADFNTDGTVNTRDLTFLLARFGQPATPGSLAAPADFNTDGTINTPDLTYFLARFATTCP